MVDRRLFLGGTLLSLYGCTQSARPGRADPGLLHHYAGKADNSHRIPAVNTNWIDPAYLRREVRNDRGIEPGSILVEGATKHLYFAKDRHTLIRYGVTLGADAFIWSGTGYVHHIRSWPSWTPTPRMLAENPALNQYRGGMPGGVRNPLGARAIYIYQNGRDTLYRVHGTHATWRIGQNYSSGCIRMLNQDVIELASAIKVGARIVVT